MSYLARSEDDSLAWRANFVQTFLERDIPQLGIQIPAPTLRRFWSMLAHYHGQTLNASEMGQSMGLTNKTIAHYLDILTGTFMVRQLQPWFENISKRQVKAPKVYFRDSGLLHVLLGIPDLNSLQGHPKLGASWEGFMLEQTLRALHPMDAYFWATHSGAALDLMMTLRGKRYGVEFKYADAPRLTKSMTTALHDLGLERLWVVYPGQHTYRIHERATVIPASELGIMGGE